MTTTDSQSETATGLDAAITSLLNVMLDTDHRTDEYKVMADQLVKLYTLKKIDNDFLLKTLEEERLVQDNLATQRLAEAEQLRKDRETDADCRVKHYEAEEKKAELGRRFKVTHDTLAIVAGNLLGIAIVVGYERAHVLTSKAFANVLKTR